MEAFQATVSGRVQGVTFRDFTRRHAEKLGVSGYVENQTDGTVFVYAEGRQEALQQLAAMLQQGPTFARVDDVALAWQDVPDDAYTEFTIRR